MSFDSLVEMGDYVLLILPRYSGEGNNTCNDLFSSFLPLFIGELLIVVGGLLVVVGRLFIIAGLLIIVGELLISDR